MPREGLQFFSGSVYCGQFSAVTTDWRVLCLRSTCHFGQAVLESTLSFSLSALYFPDFGEALKYALNACTPNQRERERERERML